MLDSGSEVNAIILASVAKLDLISRTTNVGAQKINSSVVEIYKMIIAESSIYNKLGRA